LIGKTIVYFKLENKIVYKLDYMFLKKRRLKYQDFIKNVEMETMQKPKVKPKIQALLDKMNPRVEKKKIDFIKPQTEDEWKKVHKMNEDGMKKKHTKVKKDIIKTVTNYILLELETCKMF
jgi:hypothetical protein